jgi:hypothetical protein
MAQLEHIEAIEKRLWGAADTLRANSNYASNEYFLPVMGLIFLRHAYSRYLNVKDDIVASLPTRGGKTRTLTKEDFSLKSAVFLREEAQLDYLVALTDSLSTLYLDKPLKAHTLMQAINSPSRRPSRRYSSSLMRWMRKNAGQCGKVLMRDLRRCSIC